jgi:hypothetical protein
LNEVDKMLEKAIDTTRKGNYTHVCYARYADDRAPRMLFNQAEREAMLC